MRSSWHSFPKRWPFDNPPAERLQLLDEAALIVDAGDPAGLAGFTSLYDQLGLRAGSTRLPRPYSIVRQHLMASPVATRFDYRYCPLGAASAPNWSPWPMVRIGNRSTKRAVH